MYGASAVQYAAFVDLETVAKCTPAAHIVVSFGCFASTPGALADCSIIASFVSNFVNKQDYDTFVCLMCLLSLVSPVLAVAK